VERAVVSDVPKAADQALEKLKQYVVFRAPKVYHHERYAIQGPCGRNEEVRGPHWFAGYTDDRPRRIQLEDDPANFPTRQRGYDVLSCAYSYVHLRL